MEINFQSPNHSLLFKTKEQTILVPFWLRIKRSPNEYMRSIHSSFRFWCKDCSWYLKKTCHDWFMSLSYLSIMSDKSLRMSISFDSLADKIIHEGFEVFIVKVIRVLICKCIWLIRNEPRAEILVSRRSLYLFLDGRFSLLLILIS